MDIVRMNDVSFRFDGGGRDALSHISLSIAEGGFLGIIGAGGAGKSTLAYAINGVIPHHYKGSFYGEVLVDGVDTVEASLEELARTVGCVLQDINAQMVATVVEDEILFGMENFGIPHAEIEGRLVQALAETGSEHLRHRTIASLSGGQKQRVAISAILALRPRVIVLDEPTGELDPLASRRVYETLKSLNENHGITVIVIEQKIMLLCEFAKRLAVMESGRLLLEGTVKDVLQRAEVLEGAGVNIPRVTTLARALRDEGLYHGDLPLNLPQAQEMLQGILAGAMP
jgi:energy-coupling factor transport system ATP-binding protein